MPDTLRSLPAGEHGRLARVEAGALQPPRRRLRLHSDRECRLPCARACLVQLDHLTHELRMPRPLVPVVASTGGCADERLRAAEHLRDRALRAELLVQRLHDPGLTELAAYSGVCMTVLRVLLDTGAVRRAPERRTAPEGRSVPSFERSSENTRYGGGGNRTRADSLAISSGRLSQAESARNERS